MSQWTMKLIPTDRPSSLSNSRQLSYRFSRGEQAELATYPPRLRVGDTLRIAMPFDNASVADGVSLPPGTTAKMSILSTSLEAPFAPLPHEVDLTVDPDELSWQQTITSPTDSFSFRLVVVVTAPGAQPVTYTVDPEMAVGDN